MFITLNDSRDSKGSVMGAGESPGEMLRSRREAMGVTLAVAAQRTRISQTTLFHLESNRFDEFGAELFVRGHLKSYARDLGLDTDVIAEAYERYMHGQAPAAYVGGDEEGEAIDISDLSAGAKRTFMNGAELPPSVTSSQKKRLSDGALALDATKGKPFSSTYPNRRLTLSGTGAPRKVIGRFDKEVRRTGVRRGVAEPQDPNRSTNRLTGSFAAIAGRMMPATVRDTSLTAPPKDVTLRATRRAEHSETAYGSNARVNESGALHKGLQPQSKMERAIPQIKQFTAKHFLAVIALIFAGVVVAGMLSGNRATAQDPAKFPQNAQDSWELERRAEQTRWLLEQPESAQTPSTTQDGDDSLH